MVDPLIERAARVLYGDLEDIHPWVRLHPSVQDVFRDQARRLDDAGLLTHTPNRID